MTFLNRHRSRIRPVGPFAPSSLFFGGIPGAWYDPTDLSTMFQDSTGTTPVTAVEQPVGLILDKSQGVAVGATIVTNGDFSAGTTGWSAGNSATLTSPASDLRILGDGVTTYPSAYQSLTSIAGRWYRATVTLKAANVSALFILRNGPYGAPSGQALVNMGTTPGTYTVWLYATGALMSVGVEPASGAATFDATIDNVSVVPVAGNHASQSTAASRPTYRARYNLLTFSEQFNNGAQWTPSNVTVTADSTAAPDGTTTADTITRNGPIGNEAMVRAPVTMMAGVTYTLSVYAKQGSAGSLVYLRNLGVDAGSPSGLVTFALDGTNTITAGASYSGAGQTSITSVGNGWYRCTIRGTTPSPPPFNLVDVGCSTTAGGLGGSVGAFVYIWGAQLLTAADVTATGNAYQRIAASTVYDTAPIFRPYLAFDGLDDSLATAAINFTSTDKMTVWTGITKGTEATGYMVVAEISPIYNTNTGSFCVFGSAAANQSKYSTGLNGTVASRYEPQTFTAPITNVIAVSYDIAGAALADEVKPRFNGVLNQTNPVGANCGTGNFGTWPLYVGARSGPANMFNGRLYSLIVRGAASSTTEIADTELWVNARTGAY